MVAGAGLFAFAALMPVASTAVPAGAPAPATVVPEIAPAPSPAAPRLSPPPASPPPAEAPNRPAPPEIRAIYLTSWSAATPSRLRQAISLVEVTDLNAVIIDVKDYSGKVFFKTPHPLIERVGSVEPRLGDLAALVTRLHRVGIYVAVRIAVFQDPHLVRVRPDLAVRDAAGKVWRDRKGLSWVGPAAREVWEYIAAVAGEAAAAGVDELNFDYIRFPTDGDLTGLRYPVFAPERESRREVIRRFFQFLSGELRPLRVYLSADLFGLATVKEDDLGIGQILEDALPYFDVVAPMVYPSHFARGFLQYRNPAAHPYEVVRYSLSRAAQRRQRFHAGAAALSGSGRADASAFPTIARIRPWLQAFDLGAPYPPGVIRRQIQAVRDAGLSSGWYLWSPSNRYSPAIFRD